MEQPIASSRGVVIPAPIRGAFAAVQAVSTTLAARLAERWFFTPPRSGLADEIAALLGTARRFTLEVEARPLVGWEWGAGGAGSDRPIIYLVHGWGSRGGRLGAFTAPLLDLGYRVVTFDAPGHGASGRGSSSMLHFARALGAVTERFGPAHAVIAHSLGASATVLASGWGLPAARYALLAPAANPAGFAQAFARVLGAREDVMALMRTNSERRLRFKWSDLDLCRVVADHSAPALVVHDQGDDIVPFTEGAAIAASWPAARLFPTTGLGHRGVVRDPGVVAEVVRFVSGD
jgi:pimeloyl-ACP methyl ester carboxylesterase